MAAELKRKLETEKADAMSPNLRTSNLGDLRTDLRSRNIENRWISLC